MKDDALLPGHLTPALMLEEMNKLPIKDRVRILTYQLKPPYVKEIEEELKALSIKNLIILRDGDMVYI